MIDAVEARLNPALVDILRCPDCSELLDQDGEGLVCSAGHRYPIVRGIPRLFDAARVSEEQRETADAFGYSWSHYPTENPYTPEQWADWVIPLTASDFEGRRVLDAGCGLGGFAEYVRAWGASEVVGVDLSEAVDAAADRLRGKVDLVQADLYRLPFAPGTFDVGYSIGVLHHLPDPERGFRALAGAVRPGGTVFAWVYGRENNGWLVHVVDPLRRRIFTRLPRGFLKWAVSLPLALALAPFVRLAGRVRRMPYGDYLRWLGQREFSYLHGVVFDHLVAPTSHYIPRDEFEAWFRRAGLVDVGLSWRNQNSWRGVGRVPGSAEDAQSAVRTTTPRSRSVSSASEK